MSSPPSEIRITANGVPLPFANAVLRLARSDVPVPAIAKQLKCTEGDVMGALRMLALPVPGLHEPPARTAAEQEASRAEQIDRLPKKTQDRLAKARERR